MWQELLDGWKDHRGNRNAAHADLQARFGAALGTDFDLCVYDGVDSADALFKAYLNKHKLLKGTQDRKNFARRALANLRDAWVDSQSFQPQVGQSILEFQSLVQRCSTHYSLNLS